MSNSTHDTVDHIDKVRARIDQVIGVLHGRAFHHDYSKLQEPEKSGYDELMISKKYADGKANPTIAHHYAVNTHHPEHYDNGVAGMSLLDVVEMLCDWKAASERTKQGSIAQSLKHNKKCFGIDDQLIAILENTVKELDW